MKVARSNDGAVERGVLGGVCGVVRGVPLTTVALPRVWKENLAAFTKEVAGLMVEDGLRIRGNMTLAAMFDGCNLVGVGRLLNSLRPSKGGH